MKKNVALRISGKVQGVFFRASAKEKADELSVKGFARNEPDGKVYIEAEGEEQSLRLFKDWCAQGPKFAKVDQVEMMEGTWTGFQDFKIMR